LFADSLAYEDKLGRFYATPFKVGAAEKVKRPTTSRVIGDFLKKWCKAKIAESINFSFNMLKTPWT
jgi:hypothetical protein